LVIDNQSRSDESCVGDLTVLEAQAWDLAGLVVRGYHRDTHELVRIGFPVFSYGPYPAGPRRLDTRMPGDLSSAQWDDFTIDNNDLVFADDDGVLFVPSKGIETVLEAAKTIWKVERYQAETIHAGKRLSEQLDFDSYLGKARFRSILHFSKASTGTRWCSRGVDIRAKNSSSIRRRILRYALSSLKYGSYQSQPANIF
jgi:4-hydroxy-4-methyl-2-oxoglutarate aldolase